MFTVSETKTTHSGFTKFAKEKAIKDKQLNVQIEFEGEYEVKSVNITEQPSDSNYLSESQLIKKME